MGIFSGKRIKWNHFGKKYALRLSDYEMEYADVYDALLKKILEQRPDFDGALAYIDIYGRQVIFNNDKELREAISQSKGKLKVHTTLPEGAVISAAEMAGRPNRSQSVPPGVDRGYHSYPSQSRSPSSLDSAPANMNVRNRSASPPQQISHHSPSGTTSGKHMNTYPIPPPGYSYKYASSYTPYSQNILYGLPPHNGMLLRFLANPFPFGMHHTRFIGPNKYHNFGYSAYPYGNKYYASTSWGPIF